MKINHIMSILLCSLFLTAQAAVDAGTKIRSQVLTPTLQLQQQQNAENAQLSTLVQQHLRTSIKKFNPNKLNIYSEHNEVTLDGSFVSLAEIEMVVNEVRRVPGVKQVHNNLVVSDN